MSVRLILAALLVGTTAGSVYAQSLADVAKKEEERRKKAPAPAKVYTNKDLSPTPPAPPPAASTTPAAPPAAGKDDKAAADKDKEKEPAKDQAYWSGRLKVLQTQLDRDSTFADALQSKINALTTDFSARDDPAQRAVIERDRQKSIAELNRLQKAIADDKKAIADLQEEARRAGVPPGWLR
jgi:DNA repair exonuclease SbcCD ATPase subunit